MLTCYSITELLQQKPPEWLVEGVIPVQGLTALYGNPGDGKSFIALDIALSMAAGVPWQGHVTRKGYVVYISAEGGGGISKRVGAWLEHHQIGPEDVENLFARFVVSAIRIHPDAQDLGDILAQSVGDSEYQMMLIENLDEDEDPPPLFIVVDTLARCFEGDENQQEDMGNFIKGLDILRDTYRATILVVHHTSKAGFDERGSSAFRGACDTMMRVFKEGDKITLKCTKQKDYEEFSPQTYELLVVDEWDSCVIHLKQAQGSVEKAQISAHLTHTPNATVRELATSLGLSKSTVHRRMQEIEWDTQEKS